MVALWSRLHALWIRAQVSHHGHYSVERLASLEHYCRTASRLRVALVLLLTPWPTVFLLAVIELVPLQSPKQGWDQNVVFLCRMLLALLILCEGTIRHAQHAIPELRISAWQRLGITIPTAITYVGSLMIVADKWVFPVPFTIVVGAAPCSTVFIILSAWAVGRDSFRTTPLLRERFQQFAGVVNINMSLLILYPAYNAIFMAIAPHFRYVFVLVMPLSRSALVNAIARLSNYWPDQIPVTAVFTVDTFHALYVSTFMQSTGRQLTVTVVLVFDALYLAHTLHDMRRRLSSARCLHQQVKEALPALPTDLIGAVRWLCLNQHHNASPGDIRLFDSRPLALAAPADVTHTLSRLHGGRVDANSRRITMAVNTRRAQVLPSSGKAQELQTKWAMVAVAPCQAHQGSRADLTPPQPTTQLVQDMLQLLFRHEYVVLAEYVECFVPIVYVVTQSWLHSLPNAQFFPYFRSELAQKFSDMIRTVIMYACLEIVSLLVIHVVLRRPWGFPPLYQLAFALESHMTIVQIKLLTSISIIYQFSMLHLGADFTFRFSWIHEPIGPVPLGPPPGSV